MSHELRTPLNSLLILSKLLASNQQGNLNEKQIDFARTINSAGTDLLNLINDILDLSKIESGTVSIEIGDVPLSNLRQHMERTFRQLAADKGLAFTIEMDERLPASIRTDEKRLQQIVLNLLSNAFKFTAEGGVVLEFKYASDGWSFSSTALKGTSKALAIAVSDTGIGIPEDKQKLIFEAFQQADGTTSRKYGGTGLGLSISREIARLLGGELRVRSTPGEGSTFTLYVPLEAAPNQIVVPANPSPMRQAGGGTEIPLVPGPVDVVDDRDGIQSGDRVVLIVEDDPTFGSILLSLAREAGLKGVVSLAGAGTMALARKIRPDAISLDLGLSDIDGWVLFDLLRHDTKTRRIPIHVISGASEVDSLLSKGAASATAKPASQEQLVAIFDGIRNGSRRVQRRVLIADADPDQRLLLVNAIRDGVTMVSATPSLAEAEGEHDFASFDAIVLGLGRSVKANAHVLAEVRRREETKAIKALVIYGPHSEAVDQAIQQHAFVAPLFRADTLQQLTTAVPMALGDPAENNPDMPESGDMGDLSGAKVLIVDDDIRNIYSLTSVLETYGIEVLNAERGAEGIAILEAHPDTDVALIDIMMPEMDGYETMGEIRKRSSLEDLPLIAVTAKAMKGDRQKCLDAGASDYVAKPVDIDLLLALLRVWVRRSRHRATVPAGVLARPV